jgi:hypothetical protein
MFCLTKLVYLSQIFFHIKNIYMKYWLSPWKHVLHEDIICRNNFMDVTIHN